MFILKLLNHVMEPVMYKEIEDIGKNFNIEENIQLFTVSILVDYTFFCDDLNCMNLCKLYYIFYREPTSLRCS